jgi:hypothetical protein
MGMAGTRSQGKISAQTIDGKPVGAYALDQVQTRWRRWAMVAVFNAALAMLVRTAAPVQPLMSDRNDYDYNGRQPLTAYCPNTVYCYRFLVPMLLERVAIDPEVRWKATQVLANTATGTIVAMTLTSGAPLIASTLVQTSYAFAYTAYDPYTPDPIVFLIAALVAYCWMEDRSLVVGPMVALFVLAKETVALIAAVPAIAVLVSTDRTARWRWMVPAAMAWSALLSFHWYMDTYAGWGISALPSSNFLSGSWLAIWWQNNPSLLHKALMIFAPFGFGWVYAGLGFRHAPRALKQFAVGAAPPLLALTYVQAPDRALGNAFFIVVPLATAFLAQLPRGVAWAAAVTSGLLTVRLGLSTTLLPSAAVLLVPAALTAAWAVAVYARKTG